MPVASRTLTRGEVAILRSIYGAGIRYDKVRIHSERWLFIFPKNRPMAPNGHIYFPGETYEEDFSSSHVSLNKKSIFVHEGAHLFQWYGLGWIVWARGPSDRNYDYTLVPGKAYSDYGLEAMGMIAQHYYVLKHGGRPANLPDKDHTVEDYAKLLPVTK